MRGFFLVVVGVLVAGFFAGAETGAYALNRIRLRHRVESGNWAAAMLQRVVGDMEQFVCLTLLAQNAAVYVATIGLAGSLMGFFETHFTAELVSTVTLAPVLLIVAEVLPKSIFYAVPDRLMQLSAPVLTLAHFLMWPLTRFLMAIVVLWRLPFGGGREAHHRISTHHLQFLLDEGRAEGVITPQQDVMVRNIMLLGERPLRFAMMPLDRVDMISADASRDEVKQRLARRDYRRVPVFEGARDRIVGILPVLDFLSNETASVRDAMWKPINLSSDTTIRQALHILQRERRPMGVVLADSGKAIGVVTVSDLLQQLFASVTRS